MKRFLFALLMLLLLSPGIAPGQTAFSDSLNTAERDHFYRKYRSIRDTMRINTWLNLKRVSDNLEQVVMRDQLVIDALKRRVSADSAELVMLRDTASRFTALQADVSDLGKQAALDRKLILVYKIAAAVSVVLLLTVLALLAVQGRKLRKYRLDMEQAFAARDDDHHQIDALDAEIRKLRSREAAFREELEKGMETFQNRLLALQQKCEQLEKENGQLRKKAESGTGNHLPPAGNMAAGAELPDNPDELKNMVKSLLDERNSLINLAGRLRAQAEAESGRVQEVLSKIKGFAAHLSETTGKENPGD